MGRNSFFEPLEAFKLLDASNKGSVTAFDIIRFLDKHYVSIRMSDADDIVREYDGDLDGALNYEEFCQLVLPAANQGLRSLASSRRGGYSRGVPADVERALARLIEQEHKLQRTRNEQIGDLHRCPGFIRVKSFDKISRQQNNITMTNLVSFLESNGFFPRKDDIEAILRRLDHDANGMLSYEEFCELVSVSPHNSPVPQATGNTSIH